jgi:hypothetical protein
MEKFTKSLKMHNEWPDYYGETCLAHACDSSRVKIV